MLHSRHKTDMRVREATKEDVPWLLEKIREHDKLMGYKRPLFVDEGYALASLLNLLANHVVLIAENSAPLGLIAGHVARHPFNPDIRVLSEILWWVEPSFAGKRAATALLAAFTEYGRTHVDSIICSHVYDKKSRTSALEGRGFRELERAYLMEV